MPYIENPKTKGSGVLCAIPQKGECPMKCKDCFFQSGRSFLEPLADNLPNLPSVEQAEGMVVRMNDGNDSNVQRSVVLEAASKYKEVFFNTSIPHLDFPGPVVLTINPGNTTDTHFHTFKKFESLTNLMFVRFRANTWNVELLKQAVAYYTPLGIPVILTFMAYYGEEIPEEHKENYTFRKRTLNSYNVITAEAADQIMKPYKDNNMVYMCGKDVNTFSCKRCGNCLREYYATKERMKG